MCKFTVQQEMFQKKTQKKVGQKRKYIGSKQTSLKLETLNLLINLNCIMLKRLTLFL